MPSNERNPALETERAVPWGDPGLYAWHVARYSFARGSVRGKRVLDVGSGEGYGAALLAEDAAEVIGVDSDPVAVAHAQRAHDRPNLHFIVGNALELDARLGAFDVITCLEVLEHVRDPDAVVTGIVSMLKPGGVAYLATPNAVIERLWERVTGNRHYEYHIHPLSAGELRRLGQRFDRADLYGQSQRRSAVHAALKAFDVFNLRHKLIRSRRVQKTVSSVVGEGSDPAPQFRFSRFLARQSPALMLIGRRD